MDFSHKITELDNTIQPTAQPIYLSLPFIFKIEDSGPFADNSLAFVSSQTLQKYFFTQGDIIHLYCPQTRKETIAVIVVDENIQSTSVMRINHVCRKNLACTVGSEVIVKIFTQLVALNKVVISKFSKKVSKATPQKHQQNSLIEYFSDSNRPICQYDIIQTNTKQGKMQFFIKSTQPSIFGYVTQNTKIAIDWQKDQL